MCGERLGRTLLQFADELGDATLPRLERLGILNRSDVLPFEPKRQTIKGGSGAFIFPQGLRKVCRFRQRSRLFVEFYLNVDEVALRDTAFSPVGRADTHQAVAIHYGNSASPFVAVDGDGNRWSRARAERLNAILRDLDGRCIARGDDLCLEYEFHATGELRYSKEI
ncbi:hypothetical protein Rmet_1893 [Cupriavidus metallidurans CH34]|uniref:Uncharacterized protein n=1 Tax=Cupriavidus metallidurans (strain ATCC 43123 / DSM 2839 / NBRC 102507 / CH34) TaxID=266264 RepID=Q1LM54_CUPMC|nr:hypothetical protein Rmet_1893 [Cupriavidus metallidurans CH34]